MFSQLFFLILVLLLISIASFGSVPPLFMEWPLTAVLLAFLFYVFTLSVIYSQNIRLGVWAKKKKNLLFMVANVELILFLITFYFVFGASHWFVFLSLPFADFLSVLTALVFYLGGLAVFYYSQNTPQANSKDAVLDVWRDVWRDAWRDAWRQCLFWVPFVLPFLFYHFLSDAARLLPFDSLQDSSVGGLEGFKESATFTLLGFGFMLVMLVMMPVVIVRCWQCRDLPSSDLKLRLEALCDKARFTHAGLKTWGVMKDSLTAAIMGVVGRFRYVMFSSNLLYRLSPDAIEAVLAHEIGHSKHKHLLLYPLIMSGIFFIGATLAQTLYTSLFFWPGMGKESGLLSPYVEEVVDFALFFVILGFVLAILFRLVFGYFSRLFERQADLYIFQLNIPVSHMLDAFDQLTAASGQSQDAPNWHHYSIAQRMNFLRKVEKDPSLATRHHRKVNFSIVVYLAAFCAFLYFVHF